MWYAPGLDNLIFRLAILLSLPLGVLAQAPGLLEFHVRAETVAALAEKESPARWWELASLRSLPGGMNNLTALGHAFGPVPSRPEYAFFEADASKAFAGRAADVRRSVVALSLVDGAPPSVVILFDRAAVPEAARPARWVFEGSETAAAGNAFTSRLSGGLRVEGRCFLPGSGSAVLPQLAAPAPGRIELIDKRRGEESWFLSVLQVLKGGAEPLQVEDISGPDLAGLRVGGWAILFHRESSSARSGVSFEVKGEEATKFLITGMAPGVWEIWRNGWLEEMHGLVEPRAGVLYLEAPAGSYFLTPGN